MSSSNQHLTAHGAGSHYGRWIAIAVVVAAVAIGIVLLLIYGGGGGSAPGY
jgi:hypothetical protein